MNTSSSGLNSRLCYWTQPAPPHPCTIPQHKQDVVHPVFSSLDMHWAGACSWLPPRELRLLDLAFHLLPPMLSALGLMGSSRQPTAPSLEMASLARAASVLCPEAQHTVRALLPWLLFWYLSHSFSELLTQACAALCGAPMGLAAPADATSVFLLLLAVLLLYSSHPQLPARLLDKSPEAG